MEYIAPRCCFVADSAHAIHPVAGQGLNLGIKDIQVLSELVLERKKYGLDIGTQDVLKEYQQKRYYDNQQMILATDFLVKLFSNDNDYLKILRRLGLGAVQEIPMIKNFMVKKAMGA